MNKEYNTTFWWIQLSPRLNFRMMPLLPLTIHADDDGSSAFDSTTHHSCVATSATDCTVTPAWPRVPLTVPSLLRVNECHWVYRHSCVPLTQECVLSKNCTVLNIYIYIYIYITCVLCRHYCILACRHYYTHYYTEAKKVFITMSSLLYCVCVCVYIYSVATIFGLFYKIKEFCFDKILNLNLQHIYPTFIEKDNHKRLKDQWTKQLTSW